MNLKHVDKIVLVLLGISGTATVMLGVDIILKYHTLIPGLFALFTGIASIIFTVLQTYITRKRIHREEE